MYYNNGTRYFNDIAVFSATTTKTTQNIIGDKMGKGQVIGAISLKPSQDCSIEFVYAYNDGTIQLGKELKANGVYSFENMKEIKDVIVKGKVGNILEIAIGV